MAIANLSEFDEQYTIEEPDRGVSTLIKNLVGVLVFSVVFFHSADFRGSTGEEFTVHWQIYLRLLSCAACGFAGIVLLDRSLLPAYFRFPGMLFALQLAWIGMVLPFSINKGFSVASYVSLGCVTIFVPAAISVLGPTRFLRTVGAAFVTYLVGSWIVYIAFPSIGIFYEQVSKTDVFPRMGGLGHPNELGFFSACTVVLFAGLYYCRRVSFAVAAMVLLLGAATLITCFSRTSIILTAIGLATVYRREFFTAKFIISALLIAVITVGAAGVLYGSGKLDWMIADFGSKISKSGSSDELTTGTGRTEIWTYAIGKIGEKPLLGYGYASQRFVMEDHSYHCHNVFLNYCLSSGILAGVLYGWIALVLIYSIWRSPRPEVDGILMMMLIGGLTEGLLISPTPTANILLFLSGLLWRQMSMNIGESSDDTVPRFAPAR